jgi:hypothetical protein
MALCTRAASRVARPSRNREGPTHLDLLAQGGRQGIQSPPPSPTWPRRSIPTGRLRLTGQGCAGEELRTKENPWVAIGRKGAHHRGLAAVRADDGEWMTATARTGGHQRRRCRRGRTTNSNDSYWSGGEVRVARIEAVDHYLRGRRRRHGELARLASMVGGSSSNSVLEEEATTVNLFPSLDGDRSGSAVAGHDEQSRANG